eukprot:TRINITY_DN21436_c0_g1_i1.p1 TRINITY_DN21436_c0_g1~~TRINITY_DN21436_c0_g1_i1.p1  ORF type:complete len:1041 (-),score=249.30 TRINITY_DN21436_c0_g1_i1:146-3268(-)
MALEDFFTLTEMKDGLTTLARVDELVAVMQTSDCIMKNTGNTARQWSTVATVLAATGNENCLSHFIQSDGLRFMNQWLLVSQKCNNDTSDSFVEESISSLLGALEKLPINSGRLTTSGVMETINHLLTHKNFKVQDKARSLFDNWNRGEDKDSICHDASKGGLCCNGGDHLKSSDDMKISMENGCSKSPVHDESPIKETAEGTVSKHPEASKSSGDSGLASIEDVKIPTSNQYTFVASSNQVDVNGYQGDVNSSGCPLISNTCQQSSTITEQSSLCPVEVTTSSGTCSSLIPGDRNLDDKSSDASGLKERDVDDRSYEDNKGMETEMNMKESSSCKYSKKKEMCATYSKLDQPDASPCPSNDPISLKEPDESCDIVDVKEGESHLRKTASVGLVYDLSVMEPQTKSGTADCQMPNYSSTIEPRPLVQSKGKDSIIMCLKPMTDDAAGKSSGVVLEYGLDDALEVVRQVAKEFEQEVVDYSEPLCSSSSEKNVEGKMMQQYSPDSVEGEHDESVVEKPNEGKMLMEQDLCNGELSSKEQNLCDGGSSPKVKCLQISNDTDTEPEHRPNNLRSPEAIAVTQRTDSSNDKSICSFDLNEDVCTDEIQCSAIVNQPISVSAPIPIVASFKGAPLLRTIPLHFEGELGWRGSAATSAFHPPSPRRTPDREKASLIDGSSNGSKQRQKLIKIDLNVAEGEGDDDAVLDLASSARFAPISSGLHSVDSSAEVSPRGAKRLKFDLNSVGEHEEDACAFSSTDWKLKRQLCNNENGKPVPSPASSSSSRQTPMRDFDLNDTPSFFDAHGSHDVRFNNDKPPYQTKAFGGFKVEEPVVSILGSKIDFGRKEFVNQNHSFPTNGQGVQPTNAASLASGGSGHPFLTYAPVPYPTLGYNSSMPYPTLGYNSSTMGSTMPLHPQLYGGAPGSVPYMVDSRGSPVVSSMLGSSSAFPASYTRPFFMNVMDTPSGSNGAGSSQTGPDSNSGVTSMAADGRGTGTFSQLFGHGPGSLAEEQMRSAPARAGMSLKRKEPECAWELDTVSYKQEGLWP